LHHDAAVATISIHRLVEQHAATVGRRAAIVNGRDAVSYRDLNQRANVVARHLIASGFRRGSHALVRMPRGIDLAVVLLGVLKAGGSYSWLEPTASASTCPAGVSIATGRHGPEDEYLMVNVAPVLADPAQPSPNLPILTRGSDIACVLSDADGSAAVLVPHATVASLSARPGPQVAPWVGEAGALDLWAGLMTGGTVIVGDSATVAA
jgi:non-ribosomal peptide synthetase component F